MARRIFINYRRDDSIATAGRLQDRLAHVFGRKNLFMDVDHIPAGVDFTAHLAAQVAASDVILVLIGPQWQNARDEQGRRRIDNPEDFVRIEIAAALARDIRVIPVLIDGASMPKIDELPQPLKALAHRNAVEVRNTQFGSDVQRLIEKIREALGGGAAVNRRLLIGGGAAALLVAIIVGAVIGWPSDFLGPEQDTAKRPHPVLDGQRETSGVTPENDRTAKVASGPRQLSRIRLRQAVLVRMGDKEWSWIEKDPRDNKEHSFYFLQHSATSDELTLYDKSRDMYARLNFPERRAYWRIGTQGQWNWNYDIVETE